MNSFRSTGALALITMAAFASNSILCRLALQPGLIDAASFTFLRMFSGAVMLVGMASLRDRRAWTRPDVKAATALFAYAAFFSFAYVRIPVGTGALILFPAVQLTMVGWDMMHGRRLHRREWSGLALALAGLAALTSPGASSPDALGAGLMAAAGIAWGAYSIMGRGSKAPITETASNFAYSLIFAVPLLALSPSGLHATTDGLMYAAASGALASGLGYVLWYKVLPRISATEAGILQLLVPILATLAGVVILGEPLTGRLVIAGTAIVAGVAMAIVRPKTQ